MADERQTAPGKAKIYIYLIISNTYPITYLTILLGSFFIMRAVLMTEAGGPDVLEMQEVDEPQILADDEVKIQIKAAGINPIDTKIRTNALFFPDSLPAILGCDGAGIVVAVGDGVEHFQEGDEVWYCYAGLGDKPGSYSEYIVIPQEQLSLKPSNLNFIQAAAAPLVLITAWGALYDKARLQEGEMVLIHAGAGGVGHVAIQLAKLAGAKVITTVSGSEKIDFVKGLGADEVIDYKQQNVTETIQQLTHGRGVDVILDTVGGDTFQQSIEVLAYGGSLVTLLDPGPNVIWKTARYKNHTISFELMLTPMLEDLPAARQHQLDILEQCKIYIENHRLQLHVGATFELGEAEQAHLAIASGIIASDKTEPLMGKIVLQVND